MVKILGMTSEGLDPKLAEYRSRVSLWLTEIGYTVEEFPCDPSMGWMLRAANPFFMFGVVQNAKAPALVSVAAKSKLDRYAEQVDREGEALIRQLRIGLLTFDLDSFGVSEPLREINLSVDLPAEELTRSLLYEALRRLRRATWYANLIIAPFLDANDGDQLLGNVN